MGNKENASSLDSYETLSFCDVSGDHHSVQEKVPSPDPFEFNLRPDDYDKKDEEDEEEEEDSPPTTPTMILGSKIMIDNGESEEEEEELMVRPSASSSFRMPSSSSSSSHGHHHHHQHSVKKMGRRSFSSNSSSGNYESVSTVSNVQKVNITALTSMSSKSRRIMFMFGPVKFNPEIEITSIKQRQAKPRSSSSIHLPDTLVSKAAATAAAVEMAIMNTKTGGGNLGKPGSSGSGHRQWGLLRSLSSKSRLGAAALAKPFRCLRV